MSVDASNLLVLFQRPQEPSCFPKDGGKTLVVLPDNFYTDRNRRFALAFSPMRQQAGKVINVDSIPLPDISFADVLDKMGPFSLFVPMHQKIAGQLITLFMAQPDTKKLFAVAAYCRDRLNPYLFQYALSVTITHRGDTKHLQQPPVVNIFPAQFVDPAIFPRINEEGKLDESEREVIDIPVNYTATDREGEQRLAYFREDIGVNMHHW